MKAIIFDFGGVVSLQKGLYYVPIFPDAEMWHQAEEGKIAEDDFWKKLEEYYHKTADEIMRMLFEERELNIALIEFLRTKKPQMKFGFINNGLSRLTEKLAGEWKLGEVFDAMIISSKEKLAKPDPKIFLLTCERLGAKPEECVYVGRKEGYVEMAQSLGMRGFVYKDFTDFESQVSGLLG